jgi:hypothetical protein
MAGKLSLHILTELLGRLELLHNLHAAVTRLLDFLGSGGLIHCGIGVNIHGSWREIARLDSRILDTLHADVFLVNWFLLFLLILGVQASANVEGLGRNAG